jgi:hypothetical protein
VTAKREDVIKQLAPIMEGLTAVQTSLREAERSLLERPTPTIPKKYLALLESLGAAASLRLVENLEGLQTALLGAASALQHNAKRLRRVAALIETERGLRHGPGRPAALTGEEWWTAYVMRNSGKGASWNEIRNALNKRRQMDGKPDLSIETLRTALAPRYVKKSAR